MPVLSGIKAVEQLKKGTNGPKVMTVYDDPDTAKVALNRCALGYVVKMSAGEDLLVAIHEALEGRTFISPSLRSSR